LCERTCASDQQATLQRQAAELQAQRAALDQQHQEAEPKKV
jgi:hypothetical protein